MNSLRVILLPVDVGFATNFFLFSGSKHEILINYHGMEND